MIKKDIKVGGAGCLKAKSAALLVYKACEFLSEIYLSKGERVANCKSLLGVLSMVVAKGDVVTMEIDGPDEVDAAKVIEEYLMNMPE